MKKLIIALIALIVGGGGALGANFAYNNTSAIYQPIHTATTTQSFCVTCQDSLLEADDNREWDVISNNSTNTPVWLFMTSSTTAYGFYQSTTTLDAGTAAVSFARGYRRPEWDNATSVIGFPFIDGKPSGVYLNYGQSFTINKDQWFKGEVWATSTGAHAIKIDISYK